MIDSLYTIEDKELHTLRYNNKWRILDNSGNTLGYDANHTLDHLNSINELVGTSCIFLF